MQFPLSLIFVTGLLNSIGPCAVPRMLMVLSLAIKDLRGLVLYVFGLISGYAFMALGMQVLQRIFIYSTLMIQFLAGLFLIMGMIGLLRKRQSHCHREDALKGSSAYALGLSMAWIISPCCAPTLLSLVIATAVSGAMWSTAALSLFALGQSIPILILGLLYQRIPLAFSMPRVSEALEIIGATLSIAVGGYYALLAL